MKRRESFYSLFSLLLVPLLWELAGRLGWIDARFFPRPGAILHRLGGLLHEGALWGDVLVSLRRVAIGSAIAIPLAVLMALLTESSRRAAAIARPWISFFYPLPKLAIFPLLLVIFGIGEGAKIALVAIGVFFLVMLSSAQGLRRILHSEYYDVALVYRIPLPRRVLQVLLRGALPEIVTGIKLGLGYALVMVIAAEFSVSQRGIGVFIWNAWDAFRIVDLYCGLLLIGVLGWAIFFFSSLIEDKLDHYD